MARCMFGVQRDAAALLAVQVPLRSKLDKWAAKLSFVDLSDITHWKDPEEEKRWGEIVKAVRNIPLALRADGVADTLERIDVNEATRRVKIIKWFRDNPPANNEIESLLTSFFGFPDKWAFTVRQDLSELDEEEPEIYVVCFLHRGPQWGSMPGHVIIYLTSFLEDRGWTDCSTILNGKDGVRALCRPNKSCQLSGIQEEYCSAANIPVYDGTTLEQLRQSMLSQFYRESLAARKDDQYDVNRFVIMRPAQASDLLYWAAHNIEKLNYRHDREKESWRVVTSITK